MTVDTVGYLTQEDLDLWQSINAREWAMQTKPEAYSRDELEALALKKLRTAGDFVRKYGADDTQDIIISRWAGSICQRPQED